MTDPLDVDRSPLAASLAGLCRAFALDAIYAFGIERLTGALTRWIRAHPEMIDRSL
jgi:hypothetical protein